MVSHNHSFQCFDAIMDKPSYILGHYCASPRRSSHPVELLEDRGFSPCSESKQAKSLTSEAQGTQSTTWHQPQTQNHQHMHRKSMRPDEDPAEGVTHHNHHHRHSKRIVLVRNSNPSIQKTIILRHTHVHSLGVFMDDVSELMQCLVRKLYTLDGHKIDSIQSLLQGPSILVCVGREAFHPLLVDSFQKKSDVKLPKLVLKTQSNTCNEDQGCKNNGTCGLKTKKTAPPKEANSFPQARENMMDDDIEKRILVNKDGSLSMEMKVRFRLLNNETLHCSTEIKKSSGNFNTGQDNGFCFQHNNSESFSEAESLSTGEADHTYITKHYQKQKGNPHFCAHCKEYGTWKNPVLVEERGVRHIRSSSSSASSNKIKYKKASVESMHTMSSEECTEQVVEKATCIQHTVGEEGNTTVEYCNISRCTSRAEVCSVSERTSNIISAVQEPVDQDIRDTATSPSHCQYKELKHEDVQDYTKARKTEIAGAIASALSNTFKETAERQNRLFDPSIVSHEERGLSTMSDRSDVSVSSRQEILSDVVSKETMEADLQAEEKHHSAMDININASSLAKQSRLSPLPADVFTEIEDQTEERTFSALSTVSRSCSSKISELDAPELREEEDQVENRSPSIMSVNSDISEAVPVQFQQTKSPTRASNATPTKSNASVKSNTSKTSAAMLNQIEPRLSSAMSVKSDISVISKTSDISEMNPEDAIEEQATTATTKQIQKPDITSPMSTAGMEFETSKSEEHAFSAMAEETISPLKAKTSKTSIFAEEQVTESENANTPTCNHSTMSRKSTVAVSTNKEPAGSPDQTGVKTPSILSITSEKSNKPNLSESTDDEAPVEQSKGIISSKSNIPEGSMKSEFSDFTYDESEGMEGQTKKRTESPMSEKTHISTDFINLNRSVSKTFENLVDQTDYAKLNHTEKTERPLSVLSTKSNKSNKSDASAKSKESKVSTQKYAHVDEGTGKRTQSALSFISIASERSEGSEVSEIAICKPSEEESRASSATSFKSNTSKKSKRSAVSEASDTKINLAKRKERPTSAMSAKSSVSNMTEKSSVLEEVYLSEQDNEQPEERSASNVTRTSSKSKKFVLPEDEEVGTIQTDQRPQSVLSAVSSASARSTKSRATETSRQGMNDDDDDKERAQSVSSCKTTLSARSNNSKYSATIEPVQYEPAVVDDAKQEQPSAANLNEVTSEAVLKETKRKHKGKNKRITSSTVSAKQPATDKHTQDKTPTSVTEAAKPKSADNDDYKHNNEENCNIAPFKTSYNSELSVSPISIESSTSVKREASHVSKTSVDSNIEPDKSENTREMMEEERASSSISVKSNLSNRSLKSKSTKIEDLSGRSNSSLSTKSKTSVKSENKADMAKETEGRISNLENISDTSGKRVTCVLLDDESNSLKCLGSNLKPSATMTENSKNDAGYDRSDSALSKRSNTSVKSKTSSVHSAPEGFFTPASPSVSIGIVEEYDVDEESSVSVASVYSESQSDICCKVSLNATEMTNQQGTETPDDRPNSSLTAKSSVSHKSRKSKSTQSNNDDEMASNKSVTKKLTKSDVSHASASSLAGPISSSREFQVSSSWDVLNRNQESSKVSDITFKSSHLSLSSNSARSDLGTSKTKKSKSSPSLKRPKSNASNTSCHLEVKGQSRNANAKSNTCVQSKRPNTASSKNGNETTRSQSTDISVSSENQPISRLSESFNKSKECADVNHPTMSISALESSGENGNNLTTTGDFNLHFKPCDRSPDAIDCSRIVNNNNSECSSKSEIRKTDNKSLQQIVDNDIPELVPSILPSTSPTEVVNEWLKNMPLDNALYDTGDEFNENSEEIGEYQRIRLPDMSRKVTQNEKEIRGEAGGDVAVLKTGITETGSNGTKAEDMKRKVDKEGTIKKNCQPKLEAFPESVPSSIKVMRVLLSPRLDRCNSLPEVSFVYGQRLSISARGFLDCLVNLQLLDFNPNEMNEKYKDLMNMLQSLWLCGPHDSETVTHQQSIDDGIKVNSSSGINSNSTTGSENKSHNKGEGEGSEIRANVQKPEEIKRGEAFKGVKTKSNSETPDIASRVQWTPEREFFSSSKSCGNDSNNKQELTDQKERSSGTPTAKQKTQLMKNISQDPDPLWVLNLLSKIEKQFMTHYVAAMTEFKARWKLDDSEQIDFMISELRDEVHKRIQSSINNELKKIQGRAGRPRPPKDAMTRESTAQTQQRRRRLNVLRNQSTQPAKTDDDYTGTGTDFSDQRSDDEYCPCDTCIKKRMASRPEMPEKVLNSAPVMMDFDLRKILHLKSESPIYNKENRKENHEQNSNLNENTPSSKLLGGGSEIKKKALLFNDIDNMKAVTADTITEQKDKLTALGGEDAGNVKQVCDEFNDGKVSGQQETEGEKQAKHVETGKHNPAGDWEAANDKSMTEIENSDVEIAEGEVIVEDKIHKIKSIEEIKREESETSEMDSSKCESAKEGEISDDVTEEHEDETVEAFINKVVQEEVIHGSSKRIQSFDDWTEDVKPEEVEESETTPYGKKGDISKENSETDVEMHKPESGKGALAVDDQTSEEGEPEEAETADEDITDDERAENGQTVDNIRAKREISKEALTSADIITTDREAEKAESAHEDSSDETVDDGKTLNAEILKNEMMGNEGTAEDGETADNETVDDSDSDEIPTDGETKKSEIADGEKAVSYESPEDKAETASDEDEADEAEENTEIGQIETVEDEVTAEEELSEGGEAFQETLQDQKASNIITTESEETDDDRTAEDEVVNEAKITQNEEGTDAESIDDQDTDADENVDYKRAEDMGIVKVETVEDGETGCDEIIEDDKDTANGNTSKQISETEDSIANEATDGAKVVSCGIVNETVTSKDKITDDSETDDDGTAEDGVTENGETEEGGMSDESNMAEVEEKPEVAKDREQVGDEITDEQTGYDEPTDDEEQTEADTEADGGTVEDDAGTAEDDESINDDSVVDGDTVDDGQMEDEEIDDEGTTQEEATGYKLTAEANTSFESGETDEVESRSDEDAKAVKGETGPLATSVICQCQDKPHFETPEKHKLNANGNMVNIGESAEGGDEAEDETEADESMQLKRNSAMVPTWPVHDDLQTSGNVMNLTSVANMYTGAEDGAEADGEDSETEVHAKNGSSENEDDCQCNFSG